MRWFFSVKWPLYILDASLLCEGDLHELVEVLGIPYSRTFLLMEGGEASFYVLTTEMKRQVKVLVADRAATARILAALPRYQRSAQHALKDLVSDAKKKKSILVPFQKFSRAYRLFTTYRVITRVIGYEESLPKDFLWHTGKLRLEFKNAWTEIRNELEKVWGALARKYRVPKEAIKALTHRELLECFARNNFSKTRMLHRARQGRVVVYRDGKGEKVLMGREATRFLRRELGTQSVSGSTLLRGTPACPGFARGRVRVINNPKSVRVMDRFILVTSMTTPEFVPLLKKAAAIVTDEGGLTSHAAIISREMKIPCVIGTKIATKVFKNDDRVAVDATKGIVRRKENPATML